MTTTVRADEVAALLDRDGLREVLGRLNAAPLDPISRRLRAAVVRRLCELDREEQTR